MIHKAIKIQNNINKNQRNIQKNNNIDYALSFNKNLKIEKIQKKKGIIIIIKILVEIILILLIIQGIIMIIII